MHLKNVQKYRIFLLTYDQYVTALHSLVLCRKAFDMNINVRNESDISIVSLEGRMDWKALSEFTGSIAQLAETGSKKILLDFSKMEYMSSAGIRALIEALQTVEKAGGTLAISSPSESLLELFKVVQLEKVIKIYDSEFDAIDKLM